MNGSRRAPAAPQCPPLAALALALALTSPALASTTAPAPDSDAATPPPPATLAPSGALLLPFLSGPLDEAAGARRMEWVLEQIGDGTGTPDLHRSSRLRFVDDRGHHNDFRLEHSGNLLHIPLGTRDRAVPVRAPEPPVTITP